MRVPGFVPTYLVHPPSMKNGETYEFLKSKYTTVGQGQTYKNKVGASASNFDNLALTEDQFKTVEETDYVVPDRRGVSATHASGDVRDRSKPFYGGTMYNSTFRNFKDEGAVVVAMEVEELREGFEKHCDGNGELNLKHIKRWLNDSLGFAATPDWIVLKFLKPVDENPSGRFTWDEIVAAYPRIRRAIDMDIKKDVVGKPEWLTASKKMPPKVLQNLGVKSAMQIATTKLEDRKFSNGKGGMWSCDHDMLAGTSRDTYHLPGYAGHIPMSKRNPIVEKQGDAKVPREIKNNLRLIYSHDLPGYTGHQPMNARNDIGEKKGGRDPRTTAGSAALGEDIL